MEAFGKYQYKRLKVIKIITKIPTLRVIIKPLLFPERLLKEEKREEKLNPLNHPNWTFWHFNLK